VLYIYGYIPVVVAKWCVLTYCSCGFGVPLNYDIIVASTSKKSRPK
jgi:hypothetical protein